MLDYIIAIFAGLVAGFVFWKLAAAQIASRTKEHEKKNALNKTSVLISWMLLSAALFAAVIWRVPGIAQRIEYMIYITFVLNIAVVDIVIRKIPNELLLALMITKIFFMIIAFTQGSPVKTVFLVPVVGLLVGFFLFSIPSMFKINIGAGDVKFSAVIGFCLGAYLFLQAMIIMSIILLMYLLFLIVTKKGNHKTATAMGPYLAFGTVATLLFPFFGLFV